MHDIIIIGGGPAGLTAAIYARRAEKSALIIEQAAFGGQMTSSPLIENYPGYHSASGNEIADTMLNQATQQGADIEVDRVSGIDIHEDGTKTVKGESGEYNCRAVVIATGCRHRRIGVEREEDFIGEGISYCAVCDGAFYKGRDVALVGGGNSALQEALLLSESCRKVTIVQRRMTFTGEEKLARRVGERENIEVLFGHTVDSILGEESFRGIIVRNAEGDKTELAVDGLFVAIGLVPQNEPFKNIAELDDKGYFASDEHCRTRTEGIFVAGDCRAKRIRQVTTATADGTVASLAACDYLDEKRK